MGNMFDITQQFVLNKRWLFDPTQCRLSDLSGHVDAVTLQPVSARILTLLVQAPHTVLRRKQLFDDGWRAFGFEVCDNSLNQVMHTLRSIFETIDPDRPFIRTVPRIGYSLLADVRPAIPAAISSPIHDSATQAPQVGALAPTQSTAGHPEYGITPDNWLTARENDAPLALILIDIDQLRSMNELYGRTTGDDLLSTVEHTVQSQLHRSGDHLARHDGATFAVQLADTGHLGAIYVAHCIRKAIEMLDWRSPDGVAQSVTASIGLACKTTTLFDTPTEFVDAAHAALHRARQSGGNQAFCDGIEPAVS